MARIITSHVRPPMPDRQCDWLACYDGDEETGPQGWGKTEKDAIADLIENNPDYAQPPKHK